VQMTDASDLDVELDENVAAKHALDGNFVL
jgi:hypothetical protein